MYVKLLKILCLQNYTNCNCKNRVCEELRQTVAERQHIEKEGRGTRVMYKDGKLRDRKTFGSKEKEVGT